VARGKKRIPEEEHDIAESELNLVPYLDIMMNLIMFMLLTFQVVLELKVISFNPPASGPVTDIGAQGENEEKPVMLTVMVTATGHRIVTDNPNFGTEEIPKKGDDYDYDEVSKHLDELKFPPPDRGKLNLDPNLIIVAEPQVEYETIVKTLDAVRMSPSGAKTPECAPDKVSAQDPPERCTLFPHVTLGMAVGTQ